MELASGQRGLRVGGVPEGRWAQISDVGAGGGQYSSLWGQWAGPLRGWSRQVFSWCGHGAWTQPGSFLLSEPRAHPGSCCGSRGQGLSWGDHLWEVEGGGGDVASTALAGRPAGLWEAWRGDSSELSGTGPSCSQSRREVPVLQAERGGGRPALPPADLPGKGCRRPRTRGPACSARP